MTDEQDDDFDFGFSTTTAEEISKEVPDDRAAAIAALVLPLLRNLCKNPEQEMIKWPKRDEKIEPLIEKINDILQQE